MNSNNKKLQDQCGIRDQGVNMLTIAMKNPNCGIKSLNLGFDFHSRLEIQKKNFDIANCTITIGTNEFDADWCKYLFENLKENTTLSELWLCNNFRFWLQSSMFIIFLLISKMVVRLVLKEQSKLPNCWKKIQGSQRLT